jgi:hypothetical protein
MSVCFELCVFIGTSLSDGPIPRPEESYGLWCALNKRDYENLNLSSPMSTWFIELWDKKYITT